MNPARRYPLDSFKWLVREDPPKPQRRLQPPLQGNGLSHATYAYLKFGAVRFRNQRLFKAACDLRVHGFSEANAERLLVERYLADAQAGENLETREREARSTIRSAYQRS